MRPTDRIVDAGAGRYAGLSPAECLAAAYEACGQPRDPMARLWDGMKPAQRRFLCATAGVPGLKHQWLWYELQPVERINIISAIRRAARWAQSVAADLDRARQGVAA